MWADDDNLTCRWEHFYNPLRPQSQRPPFAWEPASRPDGTKAQFTDVGDLKNFYIYSSDTFPYVISGALDPKCQPV
jgi:hypothetical protein